MRIARQDLQYAAGSSQLCAGKIWGCEAAIHAMNQIFALPSVDGVLLVDATNAFNEFNRQMTCDAADGPPPQLVPPDHLWQFLLPWMVPPDQVCMATIDGPPCCKWSPQVFTVLHGVSGIATKL